MKLNYKQNKIEEFRNEMYRDDDAVFDRCGNNIGRSLENFLSETIDEILSCLPEVGNPKLGSENQYEYIAYHDGQKDLKKEFLNNLNNKYGQK